MNGAAVVAKILKQEGVDVLIAYPVNPIIEAAAKENIRTLIVRQERPGLHMADAIGRLTSGRKIGVFAWQWGPGAENAFAGVSTAFSDACGFFTYIHLANTQPTIAIPRDTPMKSTSIAAL